MTQIERSNQVRQWIQAGPMNEALAYNGVVMWGVCTHLADETHPPDALFDSEEKAMAYAALLDHMEYHVGPYILALVGRNSIDIPAPAPVESP